MNVFSKILRREFFAETRLGCPSPDEAARLRRVNRMSLMRGGNGFRQPKAGPKLSKGGKTRKELIAAGIRRERFITVRP